MSNTENLDNSKAKVAPMAKALTDEEAKEVAGGVGETMDSYSIQMQALTEGHIIEVSRETWLRLPCNCSTISCPTIYAVSVNRKINEIRDRTGKHVMDQTVELAYEKAKCFKCLWFAENVTLECLTGKVTYDF